MADVDRAVQAARHLLTGQVFVDEWHADSVETPFGGCRKSGYGRGKGRKAFRNDMQAKNIAVWLKG